MISFATKFKKWAWAILLGAAVIGGILLWIFIRRSGKDDTAPPVENFVDKARTKLTELELREQIELRGIAVKKEQFDVAVDDACKIKNGRKRRERLAALLKDSMSAGDE
jgi:hypothetical protein